MENSKGNIITITWKSVTVNYECNIATSASTQEETDMLTILYAVEIAATGYTVHIYNQDTDVLLLVVRRVPKLGGNAALIMDIADRSCTVLLQPINDALGTRKQLP